MMLGIMALFAQGLAVSRIKPEFGVLCKTFLVVNMKPADMAATLTSRTLFGAAPFASVIRRRKD